MTINYPPVEKRDGYTATIDRLAAKVLQLHNSHDSSQRTMIGISGTPGSGKSTMAADVTAKIRDISGEEDLVILIPMDGFHLYRSELAMMPNPEEATHRRGAAFTFNAERFHDLVQDLRDPISETTKTIYAPSFDHAVKDPVENDIGVPKEARIVILEGLYLSLDREPWSSAARLMDELWFLNIDREVAWDRLVKRHVASGIVPDLAAAEHRVATTDILNADDVLNNRLPVQEFIEC